MDPWGLAALQSALRQPLIQAPNLGLGSARIAIRGPALTVPIGSSPHVILEKLYNLRIACNTTFGQC